MTIANLSQFEVLLNQQTILDKVKELGKKITADYQGESLTVIIVLKGSFIFAADLIREIDLPLNVEFMGLSSYENNTTSSGSVKITLDVKHSLEKKHVLIIEDIVDTGLTLGYLLEKLSSRNISSLKLASLLHKPSRALKNITIDYLGFTILDKFVVGYGLDFAEQYRNLPDIRILKTV